ncbi:diphthine--ammonia ligase [Limibacter armeniacum]|uniref:Dph6-related ATP pyrophosphatase n=1 Tax=Limibacter armeniacum TaxID=466084 RepID=UPI002FE58E07
MKAIFNWSGGKDSSLALYKTLQSKKYEALMMLTAMSEEYERISMHGVRGSLLRQQVAQIGLPLATLQLPTTLSMEEYDKQLAKKMQGFRDDGFTHSVFGDIFLEDLRQYREDKLALVDMKGDFPLWKIPTDKLMDEFLDLGFKAVVVCINGSKLDKSFAGRVIDRDFVKDLPKDVDVCGENGEYHSFVFDGPIFNNPIPYEIGETVHKSYKKEEGDEIHKEWQTEFYYTDILPVTETV